jgi:hypothetical protein
VTIRVEGTQEHGIATIWDADVLIWAASQIVEARDAGLRPSRLMQRHALRDPALHRARHVAARLPAPQGRAGSAAIDHGGHVHPRDDGRRLHRFSWINEWKELADASGTPLGIELILPDWFYAGVLDAALVLTIDPAYFRLTGGIERWLYRLVRKHGGKQPYGWQFDFPHLHRKSGSTAQALRLRLRPARAGRAAVAARLRPGHRADAGQRHGTADVPARAADGTGITPGKPVDGLVLSGVRGIVLSGVSYRAIRRAKIGRKARRIGFRPSNFPNLNSLTFSRKAPLRWTTTTTRPQTQQQKPGFPAWRAAP